MSNKTFDDQIIQLAKTTKKLEPATLHERLASLSNADLTRLEAYYIIDTAYNFLGLKTLFDISDFPFQTDQELEAWILKCVELGLLDVQVHDETIHYTHQAPLQEHFLKAVPKKSIIKYLKLGDKLQVHLLSGLAKPFDLELPEDEAELRKTLIYPDGLLSSLVHNPQLGVISSVALNIALNWQKILFSLGEFEEAAHIINAIFSTLARTGERKLSKALLFEVMNKTTGVTKYVASANLSALLKEERDLDLSLQLYKLAARGLYKHKAYTQWIKTLSEIATIYNFQNRKIAAVLLLEFCVLMNRLRKQAQLNAIPLSKLASVYRQMSLPRIAIRKSKKACDLFRAQQDLVNLAKTLLTHGNSLKMINSLKLAEEAYQEALDISRQITDPSTSASALSGLAMVKLRNYNPEEAKPLLDEALSIRERFASPLISVEYENMGQYYEYEKNYQMALVWYNKALKSAQEYMPEIVATCEKDIRRAEQKLEQSRQSRLNQLKRN